MNEKSHVSLERRVCMVCGKPYETGSLLLDRRLRPSLERYTTTGWGLCPEDQELFTKGFVALVECDPERSGLSAGTDHLDPRNAYRTGRLAHVKRDLLAKLLEKPIAPAPCVFVAPGIVDRLGAMVKPTSD